jgi:hypothetical protein
MEVFAEGRTRISICRRPPSRDEKAMGPTGVLSNYGTAKMKLHFSFHKLNALEVSFVIFITSTKMFRNSANQQGVFFTSKTGFPASRAYLSRHQ